jgi:hypothetical protein
MGWKLTGIVIDKNFENDLVELFNLLELEDFDLEKETTFESETSEMLQNDNLAIGFFGNGTYISTGVDLMTNDKLLKSASTNLTIIAFYVNDTTSTYCFDFYSKGQYLRKKWVSYADKNIDSSENFGEFLSAEKKEEDDLEIIFKLISSLLDKDFYEIEEGEQMFRFIRVKSDSNSKENTQTNGFWKKLFG